VEKYGTVREATDINLIWRMRFACWVNKATDTHTQNIYKASLLLSTVTMFSRRRLHFTFIPTLPALFQLNFCYVLLLNTISNLKFFVLRTW